MADDYLAEREGNLLPGARAGEGVGTVRFGPSDAWLLLAIETAHGDGRRAELAEIIAAGDAINHAIITDQELEGGFARLEQAGFIAVDGADCLLTEHFLEAWDASGAPKRRAMHKRMACVEAILGAVRR